MQFNLTKKDINEKTIKTVSAREIHSDIKSKKKFADWIRLRIKQGGFQENIDFITIQGKNKTGRPSIEYYVSIDMARHLGMMERNEQGKKVRQYFIDIEKTSEIKSLSEKANVMITMIESMSKVLKLPESGSLMLYDNVQKQLGITGLVPSYGIDSGTVTTGSSRVTKSATALLKQFDIVISAQKFNALLISAGYLTVEDRQAKEGKIKSFKSVTQQGLKYGKNVTSPQNPRETQPHWFVDSFVELVGYFMNDSSE